MYNSLVNTATGVCVCVCVCVCAHFQLVRSLVVNVVVNIHTMICGCNYLYFKPGIIFVL